MSTARQFGLIHILLALLTPIVLSFFFGLFATGCQGDEGQPVDYGPEVTADQINTELNKPLLGVDATKLQVGEYVDKIQTQMVGGQVTSQTGEVGETIVDRHEDTTTVQYKIVEIDADYIHNTKMSVELDRIASKSGGAPTAASQTVGSVLSINGYKSPTQILSEFGYVFAPLVKPEDSPAPTPSAAKQSYHNLQVEDDVIDPPADVVAQPNCGGVAGCKITVHKVTFDLLVWNNPTSPDKVHRVFQITAQTPFLANLMSECDTLLVPLEKGKTIVTLCEDVSNFKFSN